MSEMKQENIITQEKKTVDLRGLQCPMNFVRVKLSLEKIQQGDQIEFLLDKGEPVLNVTRTLIGQGHKLLRATPESNYVTLLVEKR